MPDEARCTDLPAWLARKQAYEPLPDRDSFIAKSLLSVTSVLSQLRLDDGSSSPLSPSAPVKLVLAVAGILLTSLDHNYLFVLVMLALVLARAATLPGRALARCAAVAGAAAGITFLLMLPAALLGQPQSALLMGTRALVSTGIAMEVALTTPAGELTGALRAFHVPNLVIMTLDLALRNIVRLGESAVEILTALRLRSVGRNDDKQSSVGGVGGSLLVKTSVASQETYDAMRCRGYEGEYDGTVPAPRGVDVAWVAGLALLVALFAHLEGLL